MLQQHLKAKKKKLSAFQSFCADEFIKEKV